tara:strand:- start:13061 stop:13645 length:585 start_codon:yes stop_codon:yes gene_type:complete
MATTKIGRLCALGLAATLMFGCASNKPEEPDTDDPSATPGGETPTTGRRSVPPAQLPATVTPQQPATRGTDLWVPVAGSDDNDLVRLGGKFFFDFDQAIVKRAGHPELSQHAQFLAQNRSRMLRLEGHADERGTREYNLALGERRANAVKAHLSAQGASGRQIEVISYGEEKPAGAGHDEASWAQNRRVELVYR